MVDFLFFISQKPIVVTLAILGAMLVMSANFFTNRNRTNETTDNKIAKPQIGDLSKRLTFAGYTIMMVSVALFIVAGFVSDLTP